MKILSLFDGMACGALAFKRADVPIERYVAYEIDKYATKVASHNFPMIEQRGDVFKADFTEFEGFDAVIGGSPCTYWSIARGNSNSNNDGVARETVASGLGWDLFSQYVRALREVKPRYFLYENNQSMSDEIKECISNELGCEPHEIDSADFSAQIRKRYYWTNIPLGKLPDESPLVLKDIMEKSVDEKYFYKKDFEILDMSKRVCAELKVNSMEMNRRIYNPDFKCCTLTCINGGYHEKKVLDSGRPRKLTEVEYERLQGLPDNFTKVQLNSRWLSYSKRCSLMGNGWNEPTVEWILSGLNS